MATLRKLFGEIDLTWPKVIVFALVAGAYTGAVNQVPFLANTSFTDIAVSYEWWVLFAVIVAVNCEKPLEAGLKTLAFFAISQPVVFLVELPTIGTSAAWTYLNHWLIPIVCTLPGGMVAHLMKRADALGAAVTIIAIAFLGTHTASYALTFMQSPPNHLLTVVFCLAQMVAYALVFLSTAKVRLVAAGAAAVAIAASFLLFSAPQEESLMVAATSVPQGTWEVEVANEAAGMASVDDDLLVYRFEPPFESNVITLTGEDGTQLVYDATIDEHGAPSVEPRA